MLQKYELLMLRGHGTIYCQSIELNYHGPGGLSGFFFFLRSGEQGSQLSRAEESQEKKKIKKNFWDKGKA